jgi:hypothetical protein
MDEEDKVVKVDFTDKRPRQSTKPGTEFFQTKTAGMIAVALLVALGLFAHFVLLGAPELPR